MLKNTLTPQFTRKSRVQNASFASSINGALGEGDRGAFQRVPAITGNPYEFQNYLDRWRQYCHLYEICWEARKIVRIPVEDALRKDWEIENIPEGITKILRKEEKKFKFRDSLARAWMLERLLGGCIQFFGLEQNTDDVSKLYQPLLGMSKLRFINVIPVSRISRVNWETDPLKIGYMRPNEFIINGHNMHISRCILWDGEPLFDPYDFALTQFRANLAGFGPSKLAPIWDDIVKAVGTRQAAYQLIQTNNALIMAVSQLQDLVGTNPGKAKLAELKEITKHLSLYRAAIIDKEKVTISQQSAAFGSVPELLMTFLQVLSAASDIPATRFLGQAPGGLNATGESDLENYYNVVDAMQRQKLEPAIRQFYDILGYHKWPDSWGRIREDLEIKFPPLWNINELEEAQKNQIEIANVMQCWEAGVLPDEKLVEELNLKQVFSCDLDEKDIDLMKSMQDDSGFYGADQGVDSSEERRRQTAATRSAGGQGGYKGEGEGEKPATAEGPPLKKPPLSKIGNKAEFKEEEHPRADDGKFGSGAGEASVTDKKPKPAKMSDEEKNQQKEEQFQELLATKNPHDQEAFKKAQTLGINVQPAWTDVWVNDDPNADILALGRDKKGKLQYTRSAAASKRAEIKKYNRLRDFSNDYAGIMNAVDKDFYRSVESQVLYLISKTGFRVGGEEGSTAAEEQAYGASTLTSDMVKIDGDVIQFTFTGKHGVKQNHLLTDPKMANLLRHKQGQLFNTNDAKVLKYMKKTSGKDYLTKDLRTYVGTKTALVAIEKMDTPVGEKAIKKAMMEVAKIVSAKLGNAPKMALDSYIDPMVFDRWKGLADATKQQQKG